MSEIATSKNWTDFKKWWIGQDSVLVKPIGSNYSDHPLISTVMNVGDCVIAVIDIKTMQYVYRSPNHSEFGGWDDEDVRKGGVQFVFSRVHPEDLSGMMWFSELINSYFQKLPIKKKGFYRGCWDYRVRDKNDVYFKAIQKDCVLKYDEDGKIEELLVFAFKIENLVSHHSQHLRMTDGSENLFYKYDHKLKANLVLSPLSTRELEITKLIAKSRSLKEVASDLGISFNTAKTHSANIHEKLKVKDSIEMVNLLRVFGFI